MPRADYYAGKRVLITGGSSGIGLAAAEQLVRAGAQVAIAARRQEVLERVATQTTQLGSGSCVGVVMDVADRASVDEGCSEALDQLGGLDIVINSAGISVPGRMLDRSEDVFDDIVQINFTGSARVARRVLPTLIEQGHGHICNVSSVAGFIGVYGFTSYCASKFALTGFSECLRQEVMEHGVEVSVLYPPDTDTPMLEEENKHKPPETRAVTENAGVLSAQTVANAMLRGIASGKRHIFPSPMSRLTYIAQRHFPWVVRLVIERTIRSTQRRLPPA